MARIFFSYAWGDDQEKGDSREKLVNELYRSLLCDGYELVRDKNSLEYGGYISDFMSQIGKGKCVVVAISKKYVRSEYCMFELYEIARESKFDKYQFRKRVLPILVEPIELNTPEERSEVLEYWKEEHNRWSKFLKDGNEVSIETMQRIHRIRLVDQHTDQLVQWLEDMNTMSPTELSKDNFKLIKKAIRKIIGFGWKIILLRWIITVASAGLLIGAGSLVFRGNSQIDEPKRKSTFDSLISSVYVFTKKEGYTHEIPDYYASNQPVELQISEGEFLSNFDSIRVDTQAISIEIIRMGDDTVQLSMCPHLPYKIDGIAISINTDYYSKRVPFLDLNRNSWADVGFKEGTNEIYKGKIDTCVCVYFMR